MIRSSQSELRFYPAFSGLLFGISGLPLVLRGALFAPGPALVDVSDLLACVGSGLFVAAAFLSTFRPVAGRWMATLAIGTSALVVVYVWFDPTSTLLIALALIATIAWLWDVGGLRGRWFTRSGQHPAARVRTGAVAACLLFLAALFAPLMGDLAAASHASLFVAVGVGWSFLCVSLLGLRWAWAAVSAVRIRALALTASVLAWTLLALLWAAGPLQRAGLGMVPAVVVLLVVPLPSQRRLGRSLMQAITEHPERLFVFTFATLCLAGAVLLALPISSASRNSIGLADSVFTAVSAVCVTGLVVRDTATAFSGFGQAVVLVLIQAGGLGIMTFSTAAMQVLGRRLSLRQESTLARLLSSQDRGRLYAAAQSILVFTFAVEGVVALVLFGLFLGEGDSAGLALWRAVFTAISAFCNAGFALQTQSLIPYQNNPLILHTIAAAIVLGGLSPAVALSTPRLFYRGGPGAALQLKIVWVTSLGLLAFGFLTFLGFEWSNALSHLTVPAKLHNAWFQSVTARTAGFNSVEFSSLAPATLLVMVSLMFVGGSPGSTAGGIKTTTIAVILLAAFSAIRGVRVVNIFGRRLSERTLQRAAVVVLLAALVLFLALLAVLLTQQMSPVLAVFEVVSALGTVGLSVGGTAALDGVGKLIITLVMFVGRVGPLSVFMLLREERPAAVVAYPVQEIDVG